MTLPPPALDASNRFAQQNVIPPEPDEVTIGELYSQLLTARTPKDRSLAQYLEAGGVSYPHVVVPPEKLPPTEIGPIISISWHWRRQVLAVALSDDTIRFFDLNAESWMNIELSPANSPFQQRITQISWQPMSGYVLAVACEEGTLLWDISSTGTGAPNIPEPRLLKMKGHSLVSSLSWHPLGTQLATGAELESSVIIWDTALGTGVPLKRFGGGVTCLSWSPNGNYLFSSFTNASARVWETKTWTSERWSNFAGVCQSVAWSPNGKYLAVSIEGDTCLYCFHLGHLPPRIGCQLVRINNFTPYSVDSAGGKVEVGGYIDRVAWDPSGERVVVTFQGGKPGSELIAVYATNYLPTLEFSPVGFIRGPPAAAGPSLLEFKPIFEKGALLATCWSNGKISFFPFYFPRNW